MAVKMIDRGGLDAGQGQAALLKAYGAVNALTRSMPFDCGPDRPKPVANDIPSPATAAPPRHAGRLRWFR